MDLRTLRWSRVLPVCEALLCIAGLALADPFPDITLRAGVGDKGRGKGVAWADVDGDGYLDLLVSNKGGPSRFFLNQGNGTFREATHTARRFDRVRCAGRR